MTYQALARSQRPRLFSQLIGQEPVVKVLTNSLNLNRLHHALLFTGPQGVGKTSVARIFAKALNCEAGISSNPCLECDTCKAIETGSCIDLFEIDAASHTGVDHMRDLLENVQYAPTARFKIYIIDEVHMLSIQSFNALLKTLEEPPEHMKFLLATTDPQKLPKTVLSRCLQFHLRGLTPEVITEQLDRILKNENIPFEASVLPLLAHAARGSMRDALSLLDQVIAGSDNNGILTADVKSILGYTQNDYSVALLKALSLQKPESIQAAIQHIANEGGHFIYVLDETIKYLHEIAVYQNFASSNQNWPCEDSLKVLANDFTPEDIQLFYQIAIKGSEEIHLAPTVAIGFHMIFLRMLTFRPARIAPTPPRMLEGLKNTEIMAESPVCTQPTKSEDQGDVYFNIDEDSKPELTEQFSQETSFPETSVETSKQPLDSNPSITDSTTSWADIIGKLKLQGLALNALRQTELVSKNENECLIRVTQGHLSLFTPVVRTRIEQALSAYYGISIKLDFQVDKIVQSSPAKQEEQLTEQNLLKAEHNLQEDPIFQQIQNELSTKLIKNSIKLIKNEI